MLDGRPLPLPIVYAAAGAGHAPVVKAYTAETGDLRFAITAYEPSYQGGVRVGTGDFNGDGIPDVVTAPGPDHAPVIKVFDSKTGAQLSGPLGSFLAYAPSVNGGVYVAAADVDGDHKPDIVTSAVTGVGPRIKVFSGATGAVIADFFVSGMSSASGGLTVAAADVTGDGKAEVVVGSGLGGDGWVRTYDPLSGVVVAGPLGNFRAFGTDYGGGVYVGSDALAADVDGDGTLDLAVGTRGPNAQARVRVFSGSTGAVLHDFLPFGAGVLGGARVGLAYITDDAHADMVVGSGPGNVGLVRVFDGVTGNQLAAPMGEYAPFGSDTVGVFVAASNDPSGQIYGDFFVPRVGFTSGPLDLGDLMDNSENMDPNDITVWIDWDDQTPLSMGSIVCTGDDGMGQITYDIMGEHTYQLPSDEMAPYVASVTVYDAGVAILTGTVNVTVPMPTISLTGPDYVQVNANHDDKSPWKKDASGQTQTGLPLIRDFDLQPMRDLSGWNGVGAPPAGPAIEDPDLRLMIATVVNGPPQGHIEIAVSGDNAAGIHLWTDKTKTTEIALTDDSVNPEGFVGFLPDYPACDFYVEGLLPSTAQNDVTIEARYTLGNQTATATEQLTVVPFDVSMEVQPGRNPATVTLLRDVSGKVIGLNSGQQSPANGGPPGGARPGVTFMSYVWNTGAAGEPGFIQNVTGVDSATASVTLTDGHTYSFTLTGSATYPILDQLPVAQRGLDVPLYGPITLTDNSVPNQIGFGATDTPYMTDVPNPQDSAFADLIASMELTFKARLYTVWKFDDGTFYTLAMQDWQVVFDAGLVNGVLTPDPSAIVSSSPYVITHQDPGSVILPRYNDAASFVLLG